MWCQNRRAKMNRLGRESMRISSSAAIFSPRIDSPLQPHSTTSISPASSSSRPESFVAGSHKTHYRHSSTTSLPDVHSAPFFRPSPSLSPVQRIHSPVRLTPQSGSGSSYYSHHSVLASSPSLKFPSTLGSTSSLGTPSSSSVGFSRLSLNSPATSFSTNPTQSPYDLPIKLAPIVSVNTGHRRSSSLQLPPISTLALPGLPPHSSSFVPRSWPTSTPFHAPRLHSHCRTPSLSSSAFVALPVIGEPSHSRAAPQIQNEPIGLGMLRVERSMEVGSSLEREREGMYEQGRKMSRSDGGQHGR